MKISRRDFIKLAGVSAAAAALYESSGSILHALSLIDQTTPSGEEVWLSSVCQLCPAQCGLRVRLVGGLAVKIEGNPLHPLNQGKPCPRAQAALQVLYDPDRVQHPLRRVGERGEDRWERISWEEAISQVADHLRGLYKQGQAHTLLFLHDALSGQMRELISQNHRICSLSLDDNGVKAG